MGTGTISSLPKTAGASIIPKLRLIAVQLAKKKTLMMVLMTQLKQLFAQITPAA